ncbi:MAG TPA: substrate-binding domain-containing protein [Phycisphaerae bacterium]|nr:substrate-binding domain-containing protein [Phycisphaerae bacterium]
MSRSGLRTCVGLALLAVAGTLGCKDRPQDPSDRLAARLARGTIAFVGLGPRDPLWPVLKASAERYDREMCMLHVQYLCPRGDSTQDQIDLLKSLTDRSLRGVCVQLDNVPALHPALRDLYDRGIVIVSMIKPAPQEIRVAHIGFDETAVGEALAEAAVETIGEQGSLMLLHAGTRDPVYALRLAGFDNAIRRHRKIEVLAEIDCRMDAFDARKEIKERFERFPRLSCWVALDDWPLRGVSLADRPIPVGCQLVTFGGYPDQWPHIRNGTCPVVVAANYRELGTQALQACEIATQRISPHKILYQAPLRTVHMRNLDAYIHDWTQWLQVESPAGPGISTIHPADVAPPLALGDPANR